MRKYKQYSAEFKREAVRLLESGDKTATDVAMELGIRRNQLYKWQRSLRSKGDVAFPGSGSNPYSKFPPPRYFAIQTGNVDSSETLKYGK
jgi:transposase-like protein